jgi:hypothetical protein
LSRRHWQPTCFAEDRSGELSYKVKVKRASDHDAERPGSGEKEMDLSQGISAQGQGSYLPYLAPEQKRFV